MIVKTLDDVLGTEHEVKGGNWTSRRLILRDAGMGFSMHDTLIHAGTETLIWYKNHLEAVYCIAGQGEIEVLPDGPTYAIHPGTLYALDGHEKHLLRASQEMRMICVFNPPLSGLEVHDEEGVYPAIVEDSDVA